MLNTFRDVSIIVPLHPSDESWTGLMADLGQLPGGAEIIFVGPRGPLARGRGAVPSIDGTCLRLVWVRSPLGRATQLNAGARAATRPYVWFLHADTRLSPEVLPALAAALRRDADYLCYFDLRFAADGPPLMGVNTLGVWLRSHVLGMPFGDQGFCLRRDVFWRLGGFDASAAYGEDHLLVWEARRRGIPLLAVAATLTTSARKYLAHGWSRTTAKHVVLTYRQALGELTKGVLPRRRRGRP